MSTLRPDVRYGQQPEPPRRLLRQSPKAGKATLTARRDGPLLSRRTTLLTLSSVETTAGPSRPLTDGNWKEGDGDDGRVTRPMHHKRSLNRCGKPGYDCGDEE